MPYLRSLWRGEQGQVLVEYGLIMLLIAIAVVGALGVFGQEVLALYDGFVTTFQDLW